MGSHRVWTIGSLPSNIHNRSLIWITSRHEFSRLSFRAYLSVYLRGCKTNIPRWWVVTLYFCQRWLKQVPVYICVFLKRIQPKSAGDDIRYTPHPLLAHFLRWVFGGTEPVKEGNVTRSQGRERQGGGVHITWESAHNGSLTPRSYLHNYSFILSQF